MKNNRESGVELLRILSLLGVIFIHYSDMLLPVLDTNGIDTFFVHVMRTLSAASVDVFLIVSGYFMCMNNKRTFGKPIDLIVQVSFYSVLICLIEVFIKYRHFSVPILIGNLIPDSYFTTFFVIVYVLSPYINVLLQKLNRSELNILMIYLLLIFSVYSTATTIFDELSNTKWMGLNSVGAWGSQQGFNIVIFILCYIVGAYLRFNDSPIFTNRLKLSVIVSISVILVSWSFFENRLDIPGMRSAWVYDNPLVIVMGALSFVFFKEIKFNSASVNKCAKLVYPTFLIHCFIISMVHIESFCTISILHLIVHFVVFTILMFAISFLFHRVYYFLIGKHIAKLDKYTIITIKE